MAERQSKALQVRHERMLNELSKLPGNEFCADCRAKNPRWISYTLGIFLCIRCAGIHRKMGTHISRVKSMTMDTWTADQIEMLRKAGGNNQVNSKVNPHPEKHPLPFADEGEHSMEKYIRSKWEKRLFMEEPALPPRSNTLEVRSNVHDIPKRSSSVPVIFRDKDRGYADGLSKLREMGFVDTERNQQVLMQTQGDVAAAVQVLSRTSTTNRTNSAEHLTDEQKMAHLCGMGFSDIASIRDALRRSAGNVEVAASLLQDAQKKPAITGSAENMFSVAAPAPPSRELAGRAQTISERQSAVLAGAKTANLLDVDTPPAGGPQTSFYAAPSSGNGLSPANPFTSMQPNPPQFQAQPLTQQPMSGFFNNPPNSSSLSLQPQFTGVQPLYNLQPTIHVTGSNPFSQLTPTVSAPAAANLFTSSPFHAASQPLTSLPQQQVPPPSQQQPLSSSPFSFTSQPLHTGASYSPAMGSQAPPPAQQAYPFHSPQPASHSPAAGFNSNFAAVPGFPTANNSSNNPWATGSFF
ncbi:uncharacterized protein BYT42DRAFT_581248 [Radiomyces spectabilis]|uniref:uncharacterized protein n=1 Tax=Radiomyces spectabilis TaxID=64574 RepID=UPI0022205650|nr:uncharacterized protein BYT42DRAFT_581248 [Radiomyces spectabilis]KAI8371714.1 hypothetical protein BYT42DRAFT_581248 [Radiomyces spectabilis]